MSATMIVRHSVADYAAWRAVYEEVEPLRVQHGCTAKRVFQNPDDPNDVGVIHDFASLAGAQAFRDSDELKAAMGRAGVAGPPRIELFVEV